MLPQTGLIVAMGDHGPIPANLSVNPHPAIAPSMRRKLPSNPRDPLADRAVRLGR